jgi:hypothetical protein
MASVFQACRLNRFGSPQAESPIPPLELACILPITAWALLPSQSPLLRAQAANASAAWSASACKHSQLNLESRTLAVTWQSS